MMAYIWYEVEFSLPNSFSFQSLHIYLFIFERSRLSMSTSSVDFFIERERKGGYERKEQEGRRFGGDKILLYMVPGISLLLANRIGPHSKDRGPNIL